MSYGIIPPAWNLEMIYGSISLKPAIASSLSVCFQPDSHIAYFHSSHSTLGKTYQIMLFLSSESFRSYLEKRSNSLQLPIRPPSYLAAFTCSCSLSPSHLSGQIGFWLSSASANHKYTGPSLRNTLNMPNSFISFKSWPKVYLLKEVCSHFPYSSLPCSVTSRVLITLLCIT